MSIEQSEMQKVQVEIEESRKELFNLKMSAAAGQLKDTSQIGKIRKKIARLLTQVKSPVAGSVKSEN